MLIVFNLLAVLIGLVTGSWGIYERGWPVELLLVGLLLNEAMAGSGWVWLIVPGLVLANGYLFSFYALTGAWGLWSILWPLEPLMVVGAIGVFIHQSSKGEPGAHMSRRLAQAVKRPTAITIIVVSILAIILGLVLV